MTYQGGQGGQEGVVLKADPVLGRPLDGESTAPETAERSLSLPAIAPAHLRPLNAFYRRRPAISFAVGGRSATVAASWPSTSGDVGKRHRLDIAIDDDATGALVISSGLLEAVVSGVVPDVALAGLKPTHAGLLVELALSDALAALEVSLGSRIAIIAARAESEAPENAASSTLTFALTIDALGRSCGELRLAPSHATRLTQFLDRCAGTIDTELDLPLAVCLRVAAATVSVRDVASLSPGDVIVADQHCQSARSAVAVIAEHLIATVDLTPDGGQITARPMRGRGSLWEWSMESVVNGSRVDGPENSGLDDLPVKMVFELGRIEMSLGEIRQLAPGALLPLARPVEDSVDIVANGRRIGRGTLIQIGDSLGVRVVGLFNDA